MNTLVMNIFTKPIFLLIFVVRISKKKKKPQHNTQTADYMLCATTRARKCNRGTPQAHGSSQARRKRDGQCKNRCRYFQTEKKNSIKNGE